jgi:ABC-2 type transport system ATP-binding protein
VAKLSGGQRRLDVALGILGRPDLLFLDEPTTGFDPQARRDFWELIRSLRGDGATILLTTQYLEEAEQLAVGTMLAVDTPERLGGRSSAEAVVLWTDRTGRRRTLTSARPTARLAEEYGGEVPDLQVLRPTLEDTYLSMIAPHVDGAAVTA